ncbi:MAG: hypothetical protein PHP98_05395 [Kiritimatiellae bacterium]|nr:hypothetical protein [Kiritimatiellia bacterium]
MSLLQEALKRKENEESRNVPAAAGAETAPENPPVGGVNLSLKKYATGGKPAAAQPDAPPQSMPATASTQEVAAPLPAAPDENKQAAAAMHRKTSFLWLVVALIAVLAGIAVTAGVAFLIKRGVSARQVVVNPPAPTPEQAAAIPAANANIADIPPPPAERTVTAPAAEPMPQQITATAGKESPPVAAEPKPVAVKPPPVMAKKPPAPPVRPPLKWPVLKLTGILRGMGPNESTALINGRMIGTGQTIEGATVVEVQTDGVFLKYGDEKRFLRVGTTLY